MDGEEGLDPVKVDIKTALHVAVWEGHIQVVDLLLSHALRKCDKTKLARFINRRNMHGKTALIDAAERNRPELMELLLEEPFNADWSVTDIRGFNVLHYCAFRGHRTCVGLLLRYASSVGDNGTPSSSSQSPLSLNRFKVFLNQQSVDGVTPLLDVTGRGFLDLAMLLLQGYRAEYEMYDIHGDSILHRCVQANHDDVLLRPYLEYMAKDEDQEKFRRVLGHRNSSMGRTVREACEVRGRTEAAELVRGYGG
ncbi:MAG: hypothetical protein Q9225_003067 [Loekoesia sp. 1 TL-2023]